MTKSPRPRSDPPQPTDEPTNAEEAFAEFLALQEASGSAPPRFDEWVKRYPEHEAALRQLESDWRGFDALLHGALGRDSSQSVFHRTPYAGPAPKSFVEFSSERVIGDFRLIRRIGQGGMGEVWEAEQLSLRRLVALKFIRPDRLSPRAEAYFDREARASGRLNHPGIVAVHATGREGELHWIAQELVPGSSSLNDFLKSVHAVRELPRDYFDRVARFVAELCDALQTAHEADVIHRDVKPHNILITRDDHPKLTDFGLARLTDEAALSGSYVVKGTPIYMSPEQVAGKSKLIDHRTDVFSTGAVLYELLTLHRAFEGDSSQVMARILTADAPDPRRVRAEVPVELGAIAQKALERRPADRYRTAAEMADDLRRYRADLPVRARPAGPLRRARKWVRRHPTATSVAGLGLLLAAMTWIWRDQVQRASERGDLAQKEVILTRAWRYIDSGDLNGAYAEVEEFDRLFPQDPEGHLVLAAGCARNLLQTDMEQELARAAEIGGYRAAPPGQETAMGLFLEALQWLAAEESASYRRVQRNLERARELDPKFEVVLYPLYGVRKALGDQSGAREALQAYRGTLRTSNPAVRLVDAMLTELDGDIEGAIGTLEALRAEVGDLEFSRIRGFRTLGRLLLLGLGSASMAHPERLDQAQAALEQAVADVPLDAGAWANLAEVHQRRFERTPSRAMQGERIDAAEDCARRSLAIDPRETVAWNAVVLAGWRRANMTVPPTTDPRFLADLAELESLAPDSPVLRCVQAEMLIADGQAALATRALRRARDLFVESAELDPLLVSPRVYLGQIAWTNGEYRSALDQLMSAEQVWDQNAARGAYQNPMFRFAIYVWVLGTADRLGELDLAFNYAEKARETLLSGEGIEVADAFTLAEFLALPEHGELRDCALVRELLDRYPIESSYGQAQAELLRQIEAACPRD